MQTPLMHYVSHCAVNRRIFNADMRLSMLSVGSRGNSGNEYPDDRTRDGERSTTKTCCDGVAARSADESWLTARDALMARKVRCTHADVHNALHDVGVVQTADTQYYYQYIRFLFNQPFFRRSLQVMPGLPEVADGTYND